MKIITLNLLIALGLVVGPTKHLAVARRGRAALAPGRHVVSVHFRNLPDLGLVGVLDTRTHRAIRHARLLRRRSLLGVRDLFGLVVK